MDPVFKSHPDLIKLFQVSVDMLKKDPRVGSSEKSLAERMLWVGGWFAAAPIAKPLLCFAASKLSAEDSAADPIDSLWASCWYGVLSAISESNAAGSSAKKAEEEGLIGALGLLRSYGLAGKTVDGRVAFHKLVQSFGKCVGPKTAGVAMVQAMVAVGHVEQDEEHFANGVDKAMPLVAPGETTEIALHREDALAMINKVAVPLSHHYIDFRFQPEAALAIGSRCEAMLDFLQVPLDSKLCVSVYHAKARNLNELGKYGEAEALYRQCLRVCKEKHPSTATLFECLGDVLGLQGKFDEAEQILRKAMEIKNAKLGPSHQHTAISMINLASILHG